MSAIDDKYAALGGPGGFLGPPADEGAGSQEMETRNGVGRTRDFQNGSIYWKPGVGAFSIHGGIRLKWVGLSAEEGFLGFPVTDETGTPDGRGRFNHFEGGSIYWTPQTAAWSVHGAIRDKWASMGWERSSLGYPVSDERDFENGRGRQSSLRVAPLSGLRRESGFNNESTTATDTTVTGARACARSSARSPTSGHCKTARAPSSRSVVFTDVVPL